MDSCQLTDFTLSEVLKIDTGVSTRDNTRYRAVGSFQPPMNPLRLASETLGPSILTLWKNKRPYDYLQMLERGHFMHVPRMYTTTIKSEIQEDENLSGILRTRTKKPPKNAPVNWCESPLVATGMPVRYNLSMTSLRAFVNESLRAFEGYTNIDHSFHMIKIPPR